jgi:flagellar biosynthesis protein FlhB
MAEDKGDKTEAPTPRRRQQAREQGNVARSPDVVAALILLGVMVLLHSTGPRMVAILKALVHDMLSQDSLANLTFASAGGGLLHACYSAGAAMAPLLLGVVLIAIVANVAQVGFIFNPERLSPNLNALNPAGGLGKLFNARNPQQLLLGVLKMTLLSLVAYSAIHGHIEDILSVQSLDFVQIFGLGATVIYSIALRVGITMLVLAIGDYLFQRWRHEQDLKMSKQEVKDEMRSMEGDPKIKMRRRQIAIQQLKKRLAKEVPTADVVVTNPTEFAVALKYDADAMGAPRVIAKGQGIIAAHIRQLAIASGVPILERKPLARALYKMVEVGQEIPEQFYAAVAEILAYVYELSGKIKRRPAMRPMTRPATRSAAEPLGSRR